jgi:hypothetical protein
VVVRTNDSVEHVGNGELSSAMARAREPERENRGSGEAVVALRSSLPWPACIA